MLKKIKSIGNLAVFKGFEWDQEVRQVSGNVQNFQPINIIYGRNYSGKTTLSRILHALETGEISEKFDEPSFAVTFSDGEQITENSLTNHSKKIRVFNEDFVKDNLRFISNPDDSIESFAVLGEDNNQIEMEIAALQQELGSKDESQETGLYLNKKGALSALYAAEQNYSTADSSLNTQLSDKATDRNIGIKYQSGRFGDQNYTISKLKSDIEKVLKEDYEPPSGEQLQQHELLILEKKLGGIPTPVFPGIRFTELSEETESLIEKTVGESDKIEELVKNAILNKWVSEGKKLHESSRKDCAFCGNSISEGRWNELEKHFDKESEKLEKDIDSLIGEIELEKESVSNALILDKSLFYSKFGQKLDNLYNKLKSAVGDYGRSLDALSSQLQARKNNPLKPLSFSRATDFSSELSRTWNLYESIRAESDAFSSSLGAEQEKAKNHLRLKEVSNFLVTIDYQGQTSRIHALEELLITAREDKNSIELEIHQREELISAKTREMNDEEIGAQRVNQYLNSFFGHQFLSLQAVESEGGGEEEVKQIRFEVIRDGRQAYHLSEGECSLLAFCYFLAKLQDIETKGSKPIVWIDDPISSLDSNHIFFVYSLLTTEIVDTQSFEQLFISTHNLDFLKYLKKLQGQDENNNAYQKAYFIVNRQDKISTIQVMPKYLKNYVTEFNYLFHQIHNCAKIETIDDSNYVTFYNFGNNARKFLEIYLYYKYPDQGMNESTLSLFFGAEQIPSILIDRINNEYSHLSGVFERGSTPIEVPEMQKAAKHIMERLKEDEGQYQSLLNSIGVPLETL